jgi:hypothetical protein
MFQEKIPGQNQNALLSNTDQHYRSSSDHLSHYFSDRNNCIRRVDPHAIQILVHKKFLLKNFAIFPLFSNNIPSVLQFHSLPSRKNFIFIVLNSHPSSSVHCSKTLYLQEIKYLLSRSQIFFQFLIPPLLKVVNCLSYHA